VRPFGTKGRTNDGILLKKEKREGFKLLSKFLFKIKLTISGGRFCG